MRCALALFALTTPVFAAEFPPFEAREIDPHAGEVVYAVTVADVDGDTKPDVVALTEEAVLWYQNPSWAKREILRGKTERDNVCIQPHDIDGDGRVDFAVGAGWHPADTTRPSTLQWIGRDQDGAWQVHPIACDEPTIHRIRFGDVLGNGKAQLVVAPLQGRGTKGPNWGEGAGVKVRVYSIPEEPSRPDWPSEVADDSLHTTHNLQLVDWEGDRKAEILIAGWEGVFFLGRSTDGRWKREKVGSGNQQAKPNKGASEVKLGRMADGKWPYIATIEPWHGFQVVAYIPEVTIYPGATVVKPGTWDRTVLAEPVAWGHAIWTANLDGDPDDEIIIGQRDANRDATPRGPGIFILDPSVSEGKRPKFTRHTVDDGGMACEDALAADLDGDGRPEIIAGGRATHNVKIYWNKGKSKTP